MIEGKIILSQSTGNLFVEVRGLYREIKKEYRDNYLDSIGKIVCIENKELV